MTPRQLLNFVYVWALGQVDPAKFEQWLSDLDTPYWRRQQASRAAARSRAEEEKESFRAAMAAG